MNKQEFLDNIKTGLSGLPQDEVEERLSFLGEMIDDKTEEGMSEQEAIAEAGDLQEIISKIIEETPFTKIVKEKMNKRRVLTWWEITLIIIGFPLWISLIVAFCAVVFSLYISVWAVMVSLWAIDLSLSITAAGGIVAMIIMFIKGNISAAFVMLATGLVSAGLAIFMFFGCLFATKGIIILTKKAALSIKRLFIGKEVIK